MSTDTVKTLQEQFAKFLEEINKANEAYQEELDKPKRNREARAILRHRVDRAFEDFIEFCKVHGL